MAFVIGLLTVVMVLDCLFLILLVLMQLPKKEAGAGLAFGSGATDALFGAGSGNFLTKATKYAAIVFFAFAILISVLQVNFSQREGSEFRRELEMQSKQGSAPAPTPAAPAKPQGATPAVANTNIPLLKAPVEAPATSAPAEPKK